MLLFGTFRNRAEGCHFERSKSEAPSAAWHSRGNGTFAIFIATLRQRENWSLCVSKSPGLQLDTVPTFGSISEFLTVSKSRIDRKLI